MMPGGTEMMVILLIVVLLFGANKLPQLARSSGQAMGEFKRGREEIDRELRSMSETETSGAADDAETTLAEEETDRTSTA